MKTIINKVIAVEGLDKTGKSTFVNTFEAAFFGMYGTDGNTLKKFSFPNANLPIGKAIRDELESSVPNLDVVSSPFFLSDMSHYWMIELYNQHFKNITEQPTNNLVSNETIVTTNYIFDRYFISTLAYQAFYNNSKADLDFIKTVLKTNKFLKLPTDIIMLDLPNEIIIERTLADQDDDLVDSNDTTDEAILNKRREAYKSAISFLKHMGINIHWFEDISLFDTNDLARVLLGKIFR